MLCKDGIKLQIQYDCALWGLGMQQKRLYQLCVCSHLLLAQDKDSSLLDRVPGGQIFSWSQFLAILVGFPKPIPGSPSDADMVPLPIAHW